MDKIIVLFTVALFSKFQVNFQRHSTVYQYQGIQSDFKMHCFWVQKNMCSSKRVKVKSKVKG